jgi:hypothetical protein
MCATKCITHFHSAIFLVGLIEHDLYLEDVFFLLSQWLDKNGLYLCVFSLRLTHLLQHYHDDFINKIFGCLYVGLNGSWI